MTCLSRETFRLHVSRKKVPTTFIRIYNSQVYNSPYVQGAKLEAISNKYFYAPSRGNNLQMVTETIEACPYIDIAHGSIIKAGVFGDMETFMPLPLQYLIKYYEKGTKVINSKLIKQVSELYTLPNTTHYYMASKYRALRFLVVNKGLHSFLSYVH